MARRIRIAELIFYSFGFICLGLSIAGWLFEVTKSATLWEGAWVLFLCFYMVAQIRKHEWKKYREKYMYKR